MCVYLLDVHCLEAKNALGPETMDVQALRRLTDRAYGGYEARPISAPIELVRELVLGAAGYARELGFAPHRDFQQARPHLGSWSGPAAISLGCNGKPTYISGPYDDTGRILRTLERAVGRKGVSYTVGVEVGRLPLAG